MYLTVLNSAARRLAALLIATVVLSVSPVGTLRVDGTTGSNYAGQRSANFFTGSWGYIQNTQVVMSNPNDRAAHWLGKTIVSGGTPIQWMQTGNAIGLTRNGLWTQWHYYLEYKDYTGQPAALWDFGVATGTGNVQYVIWGDGTGGVDGLGQYFNTMFNFNEGPDLSPAWNTRLSQLWTYQDAFGEVYNTTGTNEPMGRVCFGCTTFSSQFYDLGWNNTDGSTSWGLWTFNYDPPGPGTIQTPPYTYTVNSAYYNFTVD